VPKAGEPIVTDTSAGQVVNPPVVNPPVVNPPVVNPPVVNPPVKTAAELAAEKAEADRLAEVNRLAAEKAEAERQAGIKTLAEKAEADRLAAEKAAVVTTPGKLTFQPVDGVVVSAEERAKNLEAARIAQEALAKRQVEEKAEAERQAGLVALSNQQAEVNRLAALARNPDGGPSSLAPINPNTYGPQQVTLDPNTVVGSPSGINALSAQTVALPPSGPQPINPSNGGPTSATVGPITAAQRDLGPLNISNLGAVIGPQAMNSNAGGVASLVGPQVTVQPQTQPAVTYTYAPSSQQQLEDKAVNAGYQGDYTDTAAMNSFINANNQSVAPAVTQQPAVQASAVPSTQVLDSSGTPIPGRRRLGFA
jgi:hypothetical protein